MIFVAPLSFTRIEAVETADVATMDDHSAGKHRSKLNPRQDACKWKFRTSIHVNEYDFVHDDRQRSSGNMYLSLNINSRPTALKVLQNARLILTHISSSVIPSTLHITSYKPSILNRSELVENR
jgi:hypothetical protein